MKKYNFIFLLILLAIGFNRGSTAVRARWRCGGALVFSVSAAFDTECSRAAYGRSSRVSGRRAAEAVVGCRSQRESIARERSFDCRRIRVAS